MSENLYENAGELTKKCLDEIMDGEYTFLIDDEEYTEEYLKEYPYHSFSDGLTECIVKHGFIGDIGSVEEKTAFVKQKYAEKNVPLNISNIRRWFTEKRPLSNRTSRELVYQFCFAMEMNLEEVTEFFLKVYFECPFNFRVSDEVIYYFCFANGLDYSIAQELKEKTSAILKQAELEKSKIEFTTAIGAGLKNIHTEKELLQYISENACEFLVNNRTAYLYASELLNECTDLAKKFFDFENEFNFSEEKNPHHTEKKQNVDLFLYMLFGIDLLQYKKEKSFAKASDFPELVKSNFPLKMQLSKLKNNEPVSYETMRKALILLEFYAYFASLFYENRNDTKFCSIEDDYTSFVAETNDLLTSCGYPVLYVRNPFDWLFMHCANQNFPLQEFRNAVTRYYVDIVDGF